MTKRVDDANGPPKSEPVLCTHCGGNGEIVTDWKAYLGDGVPISDAVADCEPCCGTGYTDYASHLGLDNLVAFISTNTTEGS